MFMHIINKGVYSSSDAIEEPEPERTVSSSPFYNLKHLLSPQRSLKGSSDVKGSLCNHGSSMEP